MKKRAKPKWIPASKMKGMTTKRKPKKKPRRVVLGVGHPWFSTGQIGEFDSGWVTVQLKEKDHYAAWNKALRLSDLGRYNRVRLVAEVLG